MALGVYTKYKVKLIYCINFLFIYPHLKSNTNYYKKTLKLREATNDWLLPETHLTFQCQTQRREGYSTNESRPAGNTLQIGMFYTLKLHFKL